MKRIVFILCMLLTAGATFSAYAQTEKQYKKQNEQYRKEAAKLAKKQAKTLKGEKWEYTGVLPLETALTEYYLETVESLGGDKKGQEHEINNAKSASLAEKQLLLNAQTVYAQEVQTMLAADLANSSNAENTTEFENYVANVAAKSKHEFNGDVRRVLMLKKKNPDGKSYTYRAYYTIDEKAGAARSKQIAKQVDRNVESVEKIHESVLGK